MNALNPTVEIELGGETRVMRLDFNAIAAAEAVTGRSLYQIGEFLVRPTVSTMTALAWACLQQEDASLTLRDVRSMIGYANQNDVLLKLGELISAAFPQKGEDAEAGDSPLEPTPMTNRRSKNSKPSASSTSD